jgi:predicted membrane protein
LLPNILSPYLFALFLIGIFKWNKKDKVGNALKASTIFMILLTLLITAVTIPFFRYLHPVVPMIYVFAVGIMVWMVNKIFQEVPKIKADKFVVLVSSFLVLFFVVGQTLGVIFLDSRFKEKITNKGKQPVYAELSYVLKDNTNPSDVVVTNLDTWGSWYGERKTVWYPLEPDMLNPVNGEEVPFDAIYLTSYLIDDENYYMGVEWRQIFNNPEKITNKFIAEYYKLKGIYVVSSDKTYENMDARAVLLVRK